MIFPWFFGSRCDCRSEISNLTRAIERLEETRKFENSMNKRFTVPTYINTASTIPVKRKKFEFDYQYHQDNAPDYICAGGVNGQKPTEFSRSDIDNVVSEHLKEIVPANNDEYGCVPITLKFLLLVPLDLSKKISDIYGFIHFYEYPAYLKDMYENEWGCVGNAQIILYDDKGLKNNRKSECRHPRLASGLKVYSSFLVSINDKDETKKVTHIKSTNY